MKKTILTLAIVLVSASSFARVSDTDFNNSKEYALPVPEVSTFCKAIMEGDVETVKKMISLGEDINQKSLGMTPAHFAARYNKAEILKMLIANGANLKKRCDKGYTVKKYAELSNAKEALEVLNEAMKK